MDDGAMQRGTATCKGGYNSSRVSVEYFHVSIHSTSTLFERDVALHVLRLSLELAT